jgi:2-polyprenyl-3-methyl-5-hydroxy-6-metoxy-1,4-benzoquinol methylase
MGKLLGAQQALLESVVDTYRQNSEQDTIVRRLCVRSMSPWLSPKSRILEVGCSDGLMTQLLAANAAHVTVVEATAKFATALEARRLSNVEVFHQMIETFSPKHKFDCIVATWVLTHLVDAALFLQLAKSWLTPGGLLFVAVPNARVLSRQLALHMGLVTDLLGLTENDRNHGHVRTYDRPALNRQLDEAGYETIHQSGLMLKPLADFQMDQLYAAGILTDAHVEGLWRLGLEYPDFSSALFSVCRPRSK